MGYKILTKPGDTLREKTVKGGFWVFSLRIVQQLFRLVRLLILARILSPADFGLMGIALLTMATLNTFSQTGFQQALIQKKEDIKSYLNSAWTVSILRGFILFIILYFIAPYAAVFFKSPNALPIIRVIGFSVLFQAFTNIGVIYFQKELEFNKQFIYQLSGTLADFVVAVSAALILRSVWALVLGLLAGNAVRCFVSYLVHPYRPHLSSDLGKAKELFGFGKWILGSSILVFLLSQGDDILVGKLLGATALGFYQMAYRISNMPHTEVTRIISQVSFPVYSKLQDETERLSKAYLEVSQFISFISLPLAGEIFFLGPSFTKIFLGSKWIPIVPALQVLAIWGSINSISAITGPLFQGIGKPKIATSLQFVRLLVLGAILYPLTINLGILGTSLAVLISAVAVDPFAIYIGIRISKGRPLKFGKAFLFPLGSVTIMISVLEVLRTYIFNDLTIWAFFSLAVIGIGVYVMFIVLFDKFFGYGLKSTLRRYFVSITGVANSGESSYSEKVEKDY